MGGKNRAGEGPEEGQVLGTANALVRLGMREKKKWAIRPSWVWNDGG